MNSSNRLKTFFLLVGDIIALYAALFVTLALRYGTGLYEQFVDVHAFPFTIIFVLWIIIFYIAGLYDLRRLRNNLEFIKTLALSLIINAVLAVTLFYLISSFGITPKTNLFIFIVIFAVIELYWRRLFNRIATFGEAPNKMVVIGNGPIALEIKETIRQNPQLGYEITAEVTEEAAYASPESLEGIAVENGANLILVPRHLKHESRLTTALYKMFGKGIVVNDLTNFYETIIRKVPLSDLEESWFLENIESGGTFYDPLKNAWEFIFALLLFVVLLPLEVLIALLTVLTSWGPVIYRQVRVGKNGHEFTLYKFRTMRMDAEANGAQWSGKNDLRVTAFGKFLRASHLDELPQLLNIIKGELSFVGPRPERPEFVRSLKNQVPYYEVRLLVKPGVTGWAQINHHKDTTVEDVAEKLKYDIYYLKYRAPVLDAAIVIKTLKSFFINPE